MKLFWRMIWIALCIIIAGVAVDPHVVYGAEIQVSDTVPLTRTDWQDPMSIPKFDPAIGILQGVKVQLTGLLQGDAKFESLDAKPTIIVVEMGARIELQRPDGSILVIAAPTTAVPTAVEAFDGQIDYGGTSGRTLHDLISIDEVETAFFTDRPTLSLFVGTGTIDLPMHSTGLAEATGAGNLAVGFQTNAGASVTITYAYVEPGIDLKKLTNGEDADTPSGPAVRPGNPVTWTYLITNTGAIDLLDLTLVDDQEGDVTAACPQRTLAIGATMRCTVVGIAQLGQYANTAVVTGNTPPDPVGNQTTVTDSDPSHYVGIGTPAIDLEKLTNGADADTPTGPAVRPGEPVTWTYLITNTGDVDLLDLTLVDDQEGDVTFACPQRTLAIGATMRCTVVGIAQLGQYANTAIVTGDTPPDPTGNQTTVTDSDPSHYVGIGTPAIDLEKLTNGADADTPTGPAVRPGEPVTWTYLITNTGDIDLLDLTLVDDQEGDVTFACPQRTLAIGATMRCTVVGIAQLGQYANTAVVTGNTPPDPTGNQTTVTDSDPSHYVGIGTPAIDLEKLTNGADADTLPGPYVQEGATVTWTYLITNIGELDLVDLRLFDDQLGDITDSCADHTLPVGMTTHCVVTGIAHRGQYTNTAIVTGTTPPDAWPPGLSVTDSDPSHYYAEALPACPSEPTKPLVLPDVRFLGEGPGAYALPAGYAVFLVKKFRPFRFEVVHETNYVSTRLSQTYPERIWACSGACNFVQAYEQLVTLGTYPQGIMLELVVIDDDNDQRINALIADGLVDQPVVQVTEQSMVEYLHFDLPFTAEWSYNAKDSIGTLQICAR